MPRNAKVIAFSTTPEMAAQIDRLAGDENRTRSELLREAFRAYAQRGASPVDLAEVAQEAPAAYAPAALPGFELVRAARLEIKRACRARRVRRLWVFGSAVRADFDRAGSDVDFLVEWLSDAPRGPWLAHVTGLEAELAKILGRPVDVVESDTLSNSRIATSVEGDRVLVYESA